MPYIKFKNQQFPLGPADLTVGAFEGAVARLPGDDPRANAVLRLGADGTGIISKGNATAVIHVNGVLLGAEPGILLHGDRLEVGGHELRYGEDIQGGRTSFVPGMPVPGTLESGVTEPRPISLRGRLVSLVDGREYLVPGAGLSVGREIGCDVVVGSAEVSRKHAQINLLDRKYVLTDLSTNGVFVNDARVDRKQALDRGDVLRIGPEDFRFYVDAAPPERAGRAAPVVVDLRPLASLEITNEGPTKGTKFELFTPLTNVGRGAHNDVCVNDESLSASHAKILWRDGGWWLVDQDSTNGSYVGGRRVQGEQQLVGAPNVRFGGVKMIFRAVPSPREDERTGTNAIAASYVDAARNLSAPLDAAGAAPGPVEQQKKQGCAAMVVFAVSLAAASVFTMIALIAARG